MVLKKLKTHYPDAHCALHFESPFQLLIATILSAQTTDESVNRATAVLFEKFPDAKALAKAPVELVENIIRSTGFFKNKAKNILETARLILKNFSGEVPQTIDELVTLPGVGRKTANVVLGNAFHIPSGVVVDTHVTRLSNRLGWVQSTDPVAIEQVLSQMFSKDDWILLSHLLISHGRAICKARSPMCEDCFLADLCPKKL